MSFQGNSTKQKRMKFQQYITEYKSKQTEDFDKLWAKIDKDCSKYFSLLKNNPPFLRAAAYPGQMGVSSVRQDRAAAGAMFHGKIAIDFFNNWLQKNGFPRRDKSITATSDYSHARKFSKGGKNDVFYIFPIGSSWNFAYCKSKDFNYDHNLGMMARNLQSHQSKLDRDAEFPFISADEKEMSQSAVKASIKEINKFLKKYIANDSLTVPGDKGWEVWFNCKKFYYISMSINDYFKT